MVWKNGKRWAYSITYDEGCEALLEHALPLHRGDGIPGYTALDRPPTDRVYDDREGHEKVRDYLRTHRIRHLLLAGYCTDMCAKATTCGHGYLCEDFSVSTVGDEALRQLITQVGWVKWAGHESADGVSKP